MRLSICKPGAGFRRDNRRRSVDPFPALVSGSAARKKAGEACNPACRHSMLGASGGGQFLLVLPGEARDAARQFLSAAARQTAELGDGHLSLLWSFTENLGDWSVVRKRLNEELQRKRSTPLAESAAGAFQPFAPPAASGESAADRYFSTQLGLNVREAASIGWSPDSPAL